MVDADQFRLTMSQYLTGVTIISSADGNRIHGMTCNTLTSVTANPPTILVCLTKGTRTEKLVHESSLFAVNILGKKQKALSELFAGHQKDEPQNRFANVQWESSALGCPLLTDSVAYLECRVHQSIDCGDHSIILGRVVGTGVKNKKEKALGYYRSEYF